MTLGTELPGPHFETLRIVDGKIVDRWAPPMLWIEVADSREPAIPVPALTEVSATLMRVTVPGGMGYEWSTTSSGILTIESGAGRWTASTMGSEDDSTLLQPGDFVVFSIEEQVRLRSVDGPVTALVFLTAPADGCAAAVGDHDRRGARGLPLDALERAVLGDRFDYPLSAGEDRIAPERHAGAAACPGDRYADRDRRRRPRSLVARRHDHAAWLRPVAEGVHRRRPARRRSCRRNRGAPKRDRAKPLRTGRSPCFVIAIERATVAG